MAAAVAGGHDSIERQQAVARAEAAYQDQRKLVEEHHIKKWIVRCPQIDNPNLILLRSAKAFNLDVSLEKLDGEDDSFYKNAIHGAVKVLNSWSSTKDSSATFEGLVAWMNGCLLNGVAFTDSAGMAKTLGVRLQAMKGDSLTLEHLSDFATLCLFALKRCLPEKMDQHSRFRPAASQKQFTLEEDTKALENSFTWKSIEQEFSPARVERVKKLLNIKI